MNMRLHTLFDVRFMNPNLPVLNENQSPFFRPILITLYSGIIALIFSKAGGLILEVPIVSRCVRQYKKTLF